MSTWDRWWWRRRCAWKTLLRVLQKKEDEGDLMVVIGKMEESGEEGVVSFAGVCELLLSVYIQAT